MYAYEVDVFEIYEVRCIAGPLVKWTLARGEMRVGEL
jgi:hypothetical protein